MVSLGAVHDDGGPVAVLEGLKRRKRRRALAGYRVRGSDVRDCIEAFVWGRGDRKCRAASISSTGTTLFSYGAVIARWREDGALEMDCTKHSMTTSKHQSWLRAAAESSSAKVVCINVPLTPAQRKRLLGQRKVP